MRIFYPAGGAEAAGRGSESHRQSVGWADPLSAPDRLAMPGRTSRHYTSGAGRFWLDAINRQEQCGNWPICWTVIATGSQGTGEAIRKAIQSLTPPCSKISLTTRVRLDNRELAAWTRSRREAIHKAVAWGYRDSSRSLTDDAPACSLIWRSASRPFCAWMRAKVLDRGFKHGCRGLAGGSRVSWLGVHVRGATRPAGC